MDTPFSYSLGDYRFENLALLAKKYKCWKKVARFVGKANQLYHFSFSNCRYRDYVTSALRNTNFPEEVADELVLRFISKRLL